MRSNIFIFGYQPVLSRGCVTEYSMKWTSMHINENVVTFWPIAEWEHARTMILSFKFASECYLARCTSISHATAPTERHQSHQSSHNRNNALWFKSVRRCVIQNAHFFSKKKTSRRKTKHIVTPWREWMHSKVASKRVTSNNCANFPITFVLFV